MGLVYYIFAYLIAEAITLMYKSLHNPLYECLNFTQYTIVLTMLIITYMYNKKRTPLPSYKVYDVR